MLQEFQKFIMRGNVIDLAVGIIIGTAFTGIVNSLVNDVIMPPIGLLIGGVDFSDIAITLQEATTDSEAVTIGIGLFINQLISFLIIAFVVFILVRSVNNLMARFEKEEEEALAEPTTEEKLLDAINHLTAAIKEN
ncbi:MAG: large-conductance mechanosensitive channel protein MscL [Chloroflexota bacterium]